MGEQKTRTPAEHNHFWDGIRVGFVWGVVFTAILAIAIAFFVASVKQ